MWVKFNNSLSWNKDNKAYIGDDFPNPNHHSSEGEQWGRYKLPRSMYIYIYMNIKPKALQNQRHGF